MLSLTGSSLVSFAQKPVLGQVNEGRIPTPAMLFLNISPDARSAAMGDAGVAISSDVNAIYWNPAKLAVADREFGVSLSYTPWLRNLINDMALYNLSAYKKIGKGQTIGLAVNYFDQGLFQATDDQGTIKGNFNSKEYAITGSYSRVLSTHLSLGVNLKFLNSNLIGNYATGGSQAITKSPSTVAADIGLFYDTKRDKPWNYTYGLMISNISGKINYGSTQDNFVPTNFKLGMAATRTIDQHNRFTFTLDLNKLMVPTPPSYKTVNGVTVIDKGTDPNTKSALSGMFGSFGDAPDGISEELKEVTVSLGGEYVYNDMFAARVGYFNESEMKGNRKYATVGVGFKLEKKYSFDFAYLLPTGGSGSPLANTLRISLAATFDGAPKSVASESK